MDKSFVFSEAPKNLWYNWATSVGKKYTCYSYSAGTTYFFQNREPLEQPIANINLNSDFNTNKQINPTYSITLPAQGIRSALVVDDVKKPYVLLGTFSYPQEGKILNTSLFRWDFLTNKLEKILTIDGSNSIRTIIRYKRANEDILFISTQEDLLNVLPSRIYTLPTKCTNNNATKYLKKYNLKSNQGNSIFGTVWDFSLDSDTIYISIPEIKEDSSKISGFSTKGRVYYQKICKFFTKNKEIRLYNLIGNNKYPAGFNVDSLSTFQIQTSSSKEIFIYSLSDFLYQSLTILQNPSRIPEIPTTIPEIIKTLRSIASNIDLDGTRIFTINKNKLFKKNVPDITTILGNAPKNTINKSSTNNGNNNFLNVYTWQSTFNKNDIYFGTLDVRFPLWQFFSQLIGDRLQNQKITDYLLNLPQPLIIFITEYLLNINFNLTNFLLTYADKKLHFDVLKYCTNSKQFQDITLDGFRSANPSMPDDGVRNLDIVKNKEGTLLLTGSTCYQPNNSAKIYVTKQKITT